MIWFCIKLRIAQGIVVWDSGIARYDIVVFYGSWFFLVWYGIVGCLVWYGMIASLWAEQAIGEHDPHEDTLYRHGKGVLGKMGQMRSWTNIDTKID